MPYSLEESDVEAFHEVSGRSLDGRSEAVRNAYDIDDVLSLTREGVCISFPDTTQLSGEELSAAEAQLMTSYRRGLIERSLFSHEVRKELSLEPNQRRRGMSAELGKDERGPKLIRLAKGWVTNEAALSFEDTDGLIASGDPDLLRMLEVSRGFEDQISERSPGHWMVEVLMRTLRRAAARELEGRAAIFKARENNRWHYDVEHQGPGTEADINAQLRKYSATVNLRLLLDTDNYDKDRLHSLCERMNEEEETRRARREIPGLKRSKELLDNPRPEHVGELAEICRQNPHLVDLLYQHLRSKGLVFRVRNPSGQLDERYRNEQLNTLLKYLETASPLKG